MPGEGEKRLSPSHLPATPNYKGRYFYTWHCACNMTLIRSYSPSFASGPIEACESLAQGYAHRLSNTL